MNPAFRTSAPVSQRVGAVSTAGACRSRLPALSSRTHPLYAGPASHAPLDQPLPAGFLDRCAEIVGRERLLRAPGDRAPYEVDFWRHIDGSAAAVVRPRTTEEVAALVGLAAAAGVAHRAAGRQHRAGRRRHSRTDSGRQVVLSLAGLDRVRAVDPRGEWLVAEAGCTLAAVQAAAEASGPPVPA